MPVDYSTPQGKFAGQRRQAKQRGIEWLLTFDEWFGIWQQSGHWEQRGRKSGEYVMARHGDIGPYSADNVYICLASDNHSHAHANGRIPRRPKAPARNKRVVRGWTYLNGRRLPYQVMSGARYVGCFATEEEATAAYWAAKGGRAVHAPI